MFALETYSLSGRRRDFTAIRRAHNFQASPYHVNACPRHWPTKMARDERVVVFGQDDCG